MEHNNGFESTQFNTSNSRISTTTDNLSHPQVNQELPCWQNYEEEEECKAGKDEDQVGTYLTVKVREINENLREWGIIRIRKDPVAWV